MNIIQSNYHPEWQINRLIFILKKYGEDFFKNKKCKYQKHSDSALNGAETSYDCPEGNSKTSTCRKLWIVE